MTSASIDDDYEEFDDLEDDEDEDRGLSGLVVLLMGIVMLMAIASVVFIAYQHGMKAGQGMTRPPTVTADPEPIKIENTADAGAVDGDREVFDRFDGAPSEPVAVIAQGPEEPMARDVANPLDNVVVENAAPDLGVEDAVADRIAELAAADASLVEEPAPKVETPVAKPEPKQATQPQVVSVTKPAISEGGARAGSHVVQVGAFRSEGETTAFRVQMESRLGSYLDGKAPDVERADLGDKGIFYRLRLGPFASKSEAADYCAGLKDRGQDCMVKGL